VKAATPPQRRTLFDYVEQAEREAVRNKYCDRAVLKDEASVEEFFVSRLLKDLGYEDAEIRPKNTLQEIAISRGRKKENFRPDYAIVARDKPRWVVDAKATDEDVDDWSYQTAGYAHGLNQQFSGENPCQYHVVTNGYMLKVYRWDEAEAISELEFDNFVDDDPKFVALRSLLGAPMARRGWKLKTASPVVKLRKPTVEEVKRAFSSCHQLIWKAEKMNPQPAFVEFVKIMFVKLLEDKKLHDDATLGPLIVENKAIPKDRLVFPQHGLMHAKLKALIIPLTASCSRRLPRYFTMQLYAVKRSRSSPQMNVSNCTKEQLSRSSQSWNYSICSALTKT